MRYKTISPVLFAQLLSQKFQKRFWNKIKIVGVNQCWLWNRFTTPKGYGRFIISISWKKYNLYAHIVAWIIHNQRDVPLGMNILHSCIATRNCCNPRHLRIGTDQENVDDMVNQGRARKAKGQGHAMAKLTEKEVIKIRKLHSSGKYSVCELAQMFGIVYTCVWKIVRRKTWTHI